MLSCFFPAFNEAPNLPGLLDEALSVLPRFAEDFEILVVDDGSTDDTVSLVQARSSEDPRIRVISHERNMGYAAALRTGLGSSGGDAVFFTDADRQFRLGDLDRLLKWYDPRGVAVGYRMKRSDPWYRLVVARVYHAALRLVFGLNLRDVDCAFKLLGRDALDLLLPDLESRSPFISPELLIRAQKKAVVVHEVGVPHYPRVTGRAKGVSVRLIISTIKEIIMMRRSLGVLNDQERKLVARPPT